MPMVDIGNIWVGYKSQSLDIKDTDVSFYDVTKAPIKVYGLNDVSVNFHRMPDAAAEKVSGGVADKAKAPVGGRIRFATDSTHVGIRVTFRYTFVSEPHQTRLGATGFDLYVEEDGHDRFVTCFYPTMDKFEGYEGLKEVGSGKMREYTIHMPITNEVYSVEIVVKKGSKVMEHRPYRNENPIVFYGSSITHGCGTGRPGNVYSNIIARHLDSDITCLGFSGQAMGEAAMAEYIATLNMSAFVLDYDANAPTTEHLKNTHYNFYKIVRASQPDLPIIMVSAPRAELTERATERKDVIMESYLAARNAGDKNVYFIDGYTLFNGEDRTECTVDGSHPNDKGAFRMANVIGGMLKDILFFN